MLNSKVSQSNINIQQSKNPSLTSSVTSNSSTPVNSTAGLEKGQIVHGEIIDLHSNEVSVQLEDGRVLTGKLEESPNLAIGERVAFRVEDVSLKNLTLKIIADGQYIIQDNTIDKALDAAGLGKNSRNRTIVSELLNQQMSIDKKTISLLIQQSIMNKDTSINSLVLMNKYHIPITEANVTQFEAYRNSEHSMMNEIGNLAESITNLFTQVGSNPISELLTQSNGLLNLILNDKFNSSSVSDMKDLSQNIVRTPDNLNIITTGSLLSQKGSLSLAQIFDSSATSLNLSLPDLYNRILTGSADIREVAHLLNQILDSETLGSLVVNDETQKSELVPTSLEKVAVNGENTLSQSLITSMIEGSSAAQTILESFRKLQYNNNEIGSFLQASDRMNLLKSLESFPLSIETKDLIASGDISSHDLLRLIQNELSSTPEAAIKNLFSSKEYKTLLKEEILTKWEFTPESLTKEGEVDKHFQTLSNQLSGLKEYMEQSSSSSNSNISGQANHLQDNISFMKTLNEIFTYIQLPLKLKNQNAHSELYVYTKKKERCTAADGISVLLHLDMEHLGPIDVHIDLHNTNVVSKFYLNHEDTIKLISSHMPVLEQALVQKGYTLNAEVLKRSKDIDIVEDFIRQDTQAPSLTRYNFDIRA